MKIGYSQGTKMYCSDRCKDVYYRECRKRNKLDKTI